MCEFCHVEYCGRSCFCAFLHLRLLVNLILEPNEKKRYMHNPLLRTPLLAIIPISACLFVALILPVFGADQPQEAPSDSIKTQVFKVIVDLVTVTVSVTDKSGHAIKDLTQDDFQVSEEGVPQQISVFTVEVAPGVVVSVPKVKTKAKAKAKEGSIVATQSVIPLSRKIILYVDDLHVQFGNLVRLKNAGEAFIRNSLGPNDTIALMTASGMQSSDFTRDRNSVIAKLKAIFPSAKSTYRPISNCPPLTDYQAFFISTNEQAARMMGAIDIAIPDTIMCANLSRAPDPVSSARSMILQWSDMRTAQINNDSRTTLDGIQYLAKNLQKIEGRKTVVFLSDGLLVPQDVYFQLRNAIEAAVRANTVFFSINTRGLETGSIVGDLSNPVDIVNDDARIHSTLESEERFRSADPLNSLSSGTGGAYLHDNNDMLSQLKTVTNSTQVSYVLGYYSTNTKRDGKYRKISVKVKRPRTEVSAQQGYFAPKWEEAFRQGKNEDIEGALQAAEDLREIPIALSFNVTRSDSTHSSVEVQTRIDINKIRFEKRENQNQNVYNIVTVIYDASKRFVDGRETQIKFNLTNPNFTNALQEGLKHQISFSLEPGKYKVKTIVREAGETKLGSKTQTLEVAK
jgi:VWFA-related protein